MTNHGDGLLLTIKDKINLRETRLYNFLHNQSFNILLGIIFIMALFIRIAYNFFLPHINNFAACDAYEYINNAQKLISFCQSLPGQWMDYFNCLVGGASPEIKAHIQTQLAFMQGFKISGPIFPAFLACIIAFNKAAISNFYAGWQILLMVHSFISAFTVVFIGLTGTYTYNRKVGLLAALFAAFYPGFIVNSGRLYSETFATFLLSVLAWVICRGFFINRSYLRTAFISGLLATALQLTRSTMVIVTAAAILMCCLQKILCSSSSKIFQKDTASNKLAGISLSGYQLNAKSIIVVVLAFCAGALIILLPWLAFQKLSFGTSSIVVDRVGHYNFFIGNNTDTQGWLSYPYPDGRGIENKSYIQLLKEAVSKSPRQWLHLIVDKPARIFKFPWNDFRTNIGPVQHSEQVLYHQVILFLFAIGLSLSFFWSGKNSLDQKQMICRTFLFALWAFHLSYCFFITVPRYGLTAIPEMLIFASAGAITLVDLIRKRNTRIWTAAFVFLSSILAYALWCNVLPYLMQLGSFISVPLAFWIWTGIKIGILFILAILAWKLQQFLYEKKYATTNTIILTSLVAFILISVCFSTRVNGRALEWKAELNSSYPTIHQRLVIPASSAKKLLARQSYLMIDTAYVKQLDNQYKININGHECQAPIIASMSLAESFSRYLNLSSNVTQREGERIFDGLCGSASLGLTELRQWSLVPLDHQIIKDVIEKSIRTGKDTTFDIAISNMANDPLTIFGSYDSCSKESSIPSLALYSWEKAFYGVEELNKLTDSRYDLKVLAANVQANKVDLSSSPGLQNGSYNIRLLIASPTISRSNMIEKNENIMLDTSTISQQTKNIPLNKNIQSNKQDGLWILCFSGKARTVYGNVAPMVSITIKYKDNKGTVQYYNSPWVPRNLEFSTNWKNYTTVVPFSASLNRLPAETAQVSFDKTIPPYGMFNIPRNAIGQVEFADSKASLYYLPSNPLGLGYEVF